MEYRIDRRSGVATYLQIVQQTKQALRLGLLMPGDRLPTAKQVVEQTAINPNTVLKAYRELEREGLVEPRPGAGTFVRQSLVRAEITAGGEMRAELDVWMRRGREAGLDVDDVDALYAAARAAAFPPEPGPSEPRAQEQRPQEQRPQEPRPQETRARHPAGRPVSDEAPAERGTRS